MYNPFDDKLLVLLNVLTLVLSASIDEVVPIKDSWFEFDVLKL